MVNWYWLIIAVVVTVVALWWWGIMRDAALYDQAVHWSQLANQAGAELEKARSDIRLMAAAGRAMERGQVLDVETIDMLEKYGWPKAVIAEYRARARRAKCTDTQ